MSTEQKLNALFDWLNQNEPRPLRPAKDLVALALLAGVVTYAGLGWVLARVKP